MLVITVESTDSEFRVTIPKAEISEKLLNDWINWLRLDHLASKSQMTESEADEIAEQIKADWWTANKDRLIPKELQ